jgi:hypothetical protein
LWISSIFDATKHLSAVLLRAQILLIAWNVLLVPRSLCLACQISILRSQGSVLIEVPCRRQSMFGHRTDKNVTLFFCCGLFTALSVYVTSSGGMSVNNQLESIWKEAILAW